MRNVLHIMDYAAPYKGNFIRSIERLEQHLNQEEIGLVYLLPEKARGLVWVEDFIRNGKKVYFIDSTFFLKKIRISNMKCIRRIIQRENVRIIHTHFIAINYSLFILRSLFLLKAFVVGHFHSQYNPPANRYRKLKVFITKSIFDLIIGVSESVVDGVRRQGVPFKKVTSVPNAVEFDRLNIQDNCRLRESKEGKVVMMFGWPYFVKGIDTAIEAIRKLNGSGSRTILAIVLSGEKESIEQMIREQAGEIPEWIKILSPRDDIATYYNEADIFLSASREEGLSYAIIEAAYCNPQIITSDIPASQSLGIPHMMVFRTGDSENLAEVISSMADTGSQDYLEIKEAQKKFVQQTFNLDQWATAIAGIYDKFRKGP